NVGPIFNIDFTITASLTKTAAHAKRKTPWNVSAVSKWSTIPPSINPIAVNPLTTTQKRRPGLNFTTFSKKFEPGRRFWVVVSRSEEHTSELQSRFDLVCR